MITEGLDKAVKHILEDVYYSADIEIDPIDMVINDRYNEMVVLIRSEAINLADKIIGKDMTLHNVYDINGEPVLNPQEKAVFDFQVAQRVKLAEYQNPKSKPSSIGPEITINEELNEFRINSRSEGEA